MRVRDRPESRDTEEYRAALAKRGPLRDAVEATLNRHSLDAIAFPTVRTIPAVIGDPQRGSSCSLSANTGLPSLSVPAGFTAGGLPIGMEMIGRTLDDARLVAIGYAFEQATDFRRDPSTTPPLSSPLASGSVDVLLQPGGPEGITTPASEVSVSGRVTLDAPRGELFFDLSVTGVPAADVYATALRWPDGEGGWQVSHRLSGPGVDHATGTVRLSADQRSSLDQGEMHLIVLTRGHPAGAATATLAVRDPA